MKENNYIVTRLEGNIEASIEMQFNEVKIEDDYIEIKYNKSKRRINGENLKINLHQIKNIESDEDTEFYIYLDTEQRIIILTDIDVLF